MRRRGGDRDGRRAGAARPGLLRLAAASALALVAGILAGCAPAAGDAGPRFVTPPLIRYSSVLWPVPLQLVGAEPGSRLRIGASVSGPRGTWTSSATYTVPPSGTLDLATAKPQLAPFVDADSAGLFWSLRGPDLNATELAQQWMLQTVPVRLTAWSDDRVVAERTFQLEGLGSGEFARTVYTRDLAESGSVLSREFREGHPVGTFWNASSVERPTTPAVLMFEDPSPGASAPFTAPLLAQFGASVFSISVGAASDGRHVSGIVDSATVSAVLDWIQRRPDVDGRHIFVYGTGAAEQLAVWAATRFPTRLSGLFAAGGTPILLCLPGSVSPAVDDGTGAPCRNSPTPVAMSALLPIGTISGSVVLGCADHDEVLADACAWQRALASTRGQRPDDTVFTATGASHAITVPPGLPIALTDAGGRVTRNAQLTEQARIAFWDAVGEDVLRAALS